MNSLKLYLLSLRIITINIHYSAWILLYVLIILFLFFIIFF